MPRVTIAWRGYERRAIHAYGVRHPVGVDYIPTTKSETFNFSIKQWGNLTWTSHRDSNSGPALVRLLKKIAPGKASWENVCPVIMAVEEEKV